MVTLAVTKGFDLEWISNLDVLSFGALMDSIERISAAEAIRAAQIARLAQAEAKDFKKVIKDWQKAASPGGVDPNGLSGGDLKARYGKGI